MTFLQAVQGIPSISECKRPGLRALGNYSAKIAPHNPQNCTGSVDLDHCLRDSFPDSARWDYTIGYNNHAYFVEVHSASGKVSDVIEKVKWLRNWLKQEGAPLAAIHEPTKSFYWIPTNGVNIKGGKYWAQLIQNKVIVNSRLILK